MGAFLDKPNVAKENHSGEGDRLTYGLASMQGWRMEMEDAHIATTELDGLSKHAFFAVFDGHGGKTVSTECGKELVNVMMNSKLFKEGDKGTENLKQVLHDSHFDMDELLKEKFPDLLTGSDRSGTTAVSSFVTPTHIIIANCGDSRAVLCSKGGVKFGTEDHKPTNDVEKTRIERAEGQVVMGRVNGNLAVSRALGDFSYKDVDSLEAKEQKVSPEPDMHVFERSDDDEFLILACDGIWDVMSNEEAYTFVCNQLKAGYTPTETCNRMLDYCLALGSKDNMSAVLVTFPAAPEKVEGFNAPEAIPDPTQQGSAERESPTPAGHSIPIESLLSAIMGARPGEGEEGGPLPVPEHILEESRAVAEASRADAARRAAANEGEGTDSAKDGSDQGEAGQEVAAEEKAEGQTKADSSEGTATAKAEEAKSSADTPASAGEESKAEADKKEKPEEQSQNAEASKESTGGNGGDGGSGGGDDAPASGDSKQGDDNEGER